MSLPEPVGLAYSVADPPSTGPSGIEMVLPATFAATADPGRPGPDPSVSSVYVGVPTIAYRASTGSVITGDPYMVVPLGTVAVTVNVTTSPMVAWVAELLPPSTTLDAVFVTVAPPTVTSTVSSARSVLGVTVVSTLFDG